MNAGIVDQIGIITSCPKCGQKNRLRYIHLENQNRCGKCQTPLPLPDYPIETPNYSAFYALTQNSAVPVLVDFWAPWCGPCKMVAPEVEQVAKLTNGEFLVVKANTESMPEAGQMHNIRSIPTMAIFFKGRELNRISGAMPAAQILRFARESIKP